MNRINLEQRGTAKWLAFVGCDVSQPQRAPQASVLEAVRFVMEQLRPEIRGAAWIDTNADSLRIGDIQGIYPTIRACPRLVADAAQPALAPDRRSRDCWSGVRSHNRAVCNENGSALVAVGERKAEEPGSVMDRLEDLANEIHGTMIEHV